MVRGVDLRRMEFAGDWKLKVAQSLGLQAHPSQTLSSLRVRILRIWRILSILSLSTSILRFLHSRPVSC